jgi:glycosyltransferase involved in cell wall biosynthesis
MVEKSKRYESPLSEKYSPMISVVIPAYNCAEFLPECLDSVLNQTWRKLECIIVDDGSVDNTREVVKKYVLNDSRIRYYHQENRGNSAARNFGIEQAKGELITLLDADDWLNKHLYETQVQSITENNLVGKKFVIYSDHQVVWKSKKTGETLREELIYARCADKQELIKKMLGVRRESFPPLHFNCALISKEVFDHIQFSIPLIAYEDVECWYRILISDAEFVHVPVTGMYYRRQKNFITTNKSRMRTGYLLCLENIYRLNKDDLIYMQDMDEMLRYFSILRDKVMLKRAKYILKNSQIPVYNRSGRDIKKVLLVIDRLRILDVYIFLLFLEHIANNMKTKTRALAGLLYHTLVH